MTKEASQNTNWVGVFILGKLTKAMLQDAHQNATKFWDVTRSKITSVVLTSTLSTRAGDIGNDLMDDQPMPYLAYEDVTLAVNAKSSTK